jgi:hypothetical protein
VECTSVQFWNEVRLGRLEILVAVNCFMGSTPGVKERQCMLIKSMVRFVLQGRQFSEKGNGIFSVQETGSTQTELDPIELQHPDTGRPPAQTGQCIHHGELSRKLE